MSAADRHGPSAALRPLGPAQLEGRAPACDGLFDAGPWTPRAVAETLASPGAFGFLVGESDGWAGLVLARAVADECEILWLAVAPDRRGRGIGRALLEAALERAGTLGARTAFLEVAEGNEAALALYRAAGFHPRGRRPGYYAATSEGAMRAAVAMRRRLGGPPGRDGLAN